MPFWPFKTPSLLNYFETRVKPYEAFVKALTTPYDTPLYIPFMGSFKIAPLRLWLMKGPEAHHGQPGAAPVRKL